MRTPADMLSATIVPETPDVETASESYARRFAGAAGAYLLAKQEAAIRAALCDWRGRSVLDVGGGHAQLTPILRTLASEIVVVGSDERSLERVRREFADCATATGNLLALPFESKAFDLVVAVRLLPHVRNWQKLLSELCRVARSTVVIDYPRTTGLNRLTPLLFPLKLRLEGNTRHYRNFRDGELDAAFAEHGFDVRGREAQFIVPMVVHRRTNAAASLRMVERAAAALRITRLHGSPVVLRADRRA